MKSVYKILDVVRLSLRNLVTHAARSVLTTLSILFGVWGVIAMLAMNEGARIEAERSLRELGSSNIIIETVPPPQESAKATAQSWGAKIYGIKQIEADQICDNTPAVVRSAISHRTRKVARVGHHVLNVTVIGTEPVYAEVGRIEIVAGRFISHVDNLRRLPATVITASLAGRLFPGEDPVGQAIRLGPTGEAFTIVGVLQRLPRAMAGAGVDPDNCIVIPFLTDRSRHGELTVVISGSDRSFERVEVSQIILQMADEAAVLAGADVVRSILERSHEEKDYKIEVPLELLMQQAKQRRLWNIMFISIALVSLVVGGIGIANIMLASVTERTREIGVRRAMGAKRRDITVQFLVEAVTLTTVGGLLGIGMGLPIPAVIRTFMGLPAATSAFMLFLPFVVSVTVGLASGLYPALRAARLDPIVALRHE